MNNLKKCPKKAKAHHKQVRKLPIRKRRQIIFFAVCVFAK